MDHGYIFQLDNGSLLGGLVFRRWYDVSEFVAAGSLDNFLAVRAATERIGVPELQQVPTTGYRPELEELAWFMKTSWVSERFSSYGGTFLVKTVFELDPDKFRVFLQSKTSAQLNRYLDEARI